MKEMASDRSMSEVSSESSVSSVEEVTPSLITTNPDCSMGSSQSNVGRASSIRARTSASSLSRILAKVTVPVGSDSPPPTAPNAAAGGISVERMMLPFAGDPSVGSTVGNKEVTEVPSAISGPSSLGRLPGPGVLSTTIR